MRLIAISWSGTTVDMRDASLRTSAQSVPNGNCSETAALTGEMPAEVGARADRVIARVGAIAGDVLIFSSGHFLRVLAARWCNRPGFSPS